mmetsp:Transcript_23661/g.55988  ORF Transcript_23661/g.55988 Transcript_23661/m.55988 type:complete len:266 (-) Transcript_23661:80-877(-)
MICKLLLLALALVGPVVDGTCHCGDICPFYTKAHDCRESFGNVDSSYSWIPEYFETCWQTDKTCDDAYLGMQFWDGPSVSKNSAVCLEAGIDGPKDKGAQDCYQPCAGYCVCNAFGCNCDACRNCAETQVWGCLSRRQRQLDDSSNLVNETEVKDDDDGCADFDEYMSFTPEEKVARLESLHCKGNNKAKPEIEALAIAQIEQRIGGEADGVLSCEEFNHDAAYIAMDVEMVCDEIDNSSTETTTTTFVVPLLMMTATAVTLQFW